MTFRAIADFFRDRGALPVEVNAVLGWIRQNTDHKDIELHAVKRDGRGYRGGFRRKAIPIGIYGSDFEILTQVFYGGDLPAEWARLVIVKEVLHVFDGPQALVETPVALRQLIPAIIAPELKGPIFLPALNDDLGVYRAMALLVPSPARERMANAVEQGDRTVSEVADYVRLPEMYVDIWLRYGKQVEQTLLPVVAGDLKAAG